MSANAGAIAPLKFAIVATVEKESIDADRDGARTSLDQIPLGNAHFLLGRTLRAAIIALAMIIATTAASSAQSCPSSPDYTPDFSSNGNCLAYNYDATLVTNDSTVLQLTTSTGNQVGSAWYLTPQTVTNGFSTTFQFQFTNPSTPPADGIAFLIQNYSTTAIGYTGSGGALAYGDDDSNTNPSTGEGIPYSVAIEFDTYQNGWDPAPVNGVDSHVAIQSCGTGPNTSHHGYTCDGTPSGPNSTLGQPVSTESSGINFADGNVHTVTIDYTPACSTCSPATVASIAVYVDGVDIYPGGVAVNLSTIASETGTAYVGFTGATGADYETQQILNWTFAPVQGTPISSSNPSSLNQTFVISGVPGQYWSFDFNESTANSNGTLTIQPGTIPYISSSWIGETTWASIVNGTAMADTSCLLSAVDPNACAINTMTCTDSANPNTPLGAYCPQSTARNMLFDQEIDVVQTQTGIESGILTIPSGYAPGFALLPDTFPPDPCVYPTTGPLGGQLCPQSILTRLADNSPKPGGTTTTTNSSYAFFCCEPEWVTTPSIAFWNNKVLVPASFTSVPPPTPSPNPNDFQAAQGAFVTVGAEPHGTVLDTTYPLPGEQSLYNPVPCPALAAPPANPWSNQNPQTFSVSGTITNYDNGTSTPAPLTEGPFDAHYFSVDCDSFEELVFPATLNVSPGTPGGNNASFKTVQFNIDTTPPQVTSITLNPAGGYYQPNAVVTATVACYDPPSVTSPVPDFYSGIATCGALGSPQVFAGGQQSVTTTPITLNTSTVGSQTFTATATDVAGNVSPPMSVNYQVVGSATLYELLLGNLTVETGKNITYTIIVVNGGPSTADEVTVTNPIPAGTTFVSSGYAIDTCSVTAGIPSCSITAPTNSCGNVAGTCNIGALPAWTNKTNPVGAVVQITVNVTAKANSTITDSETLTEANSNPNSKNDSQTWKTCVTK